MEGVLLKSNGDELGSTVEVTGLGNPSKEGNTLGSYEL